MRGRDAMRRVHAYLFIKKASRHIGPLAMKMRVCKIRDLAATRRALQESLFYKERLVDLFQGAGVLPESGGYCGEPAQGPL